MVPSLSLPLSFISTCTCEERARNWVTAGLGCWVIYLPDRIARSLCSSELFFSSKSSMSGGLHRRDTQIRVYLKQCLAIKHPRENPASPGGPFWAFPSQSCVCVYHLTDTDASFVTFRTDHFRRFSVGMFSLPRCLSIFPSQCRSIWLVCLK